MTHKPIAWLVVCTLVLTTLAGCGGLDSLLPANTPAASGQVTAGQPTDEPAAPATAPLAAATEVMAGNKDDHDKAADREWDATQAVQITLDGDSIAVTGGGVTVNGTVATITAAGTYQLQGTLADGQIVVDTQDQELVQLILAGVDIHSATSAPLFVRSAEETVILLAQGTTNRLTDGDSYTLEPGTDEPNATLFSRDDLTISGGGSLVIEAHYNDALASKDGLVIAGGQLTLTAADDGLRGKDYLVIKDGQISVQAGGDGLKSDENDDPAKGYVLVEQGRLDVTAGGDAISAETDVIVTGGKLALSSGGGSGGRIAADASAKGIKGAVSVTIDGGTLTIDSADDALHSNGAIVINNGSLTLASGDDGAHADSTLDINGGDIQVTSSYEGLESAVITINDGRIRIVSSDDGINIAAGGDGSGMDMGPGFGGPGGQPGGPGGQPGGPGGGWPGGGRDSFNYDGDYYLYVRGGYVAIDARGDGIDSNGGIEMSDGVVLINGPTENMNSALDMLSAKIDGGLLVAVGSAGMAQAPSDASAQNSVMLNLGGTLRAGTLFRIETTGGQEILTFAPTKNYASVVFSSPDLQQGATYVVYYGGESGGTVSDSLYQGGDYRGGTELGSFTTSGTVTRLGGRR